MGSGRGARGVGLDEEVGEEAAVLCTAVLLGDAVLLGRAAVLLGATAGAPGRDQRMRGKNRMDIPELTNLAK